MTRSSFRARTCNRPVLLAAAIALIALALAGCTTKVVTAPSATPLNTVTASGSGTVHAKPDVAEMSFGVTKQAAKADAALQQASSAAEKIAAALSKAGVANKDIQTQSVNVSPVYSTAPPNGTAAPSIVGYQASISVNATVRDLASLGDVISAANSAGADTINGPTFTIADDAPYRAQAIQKAVDDARAQAQAMAKAAGKTVGAVLSMSAANVSVPVPLFGSAAGAESAAPKSVPIQPGQLDVTANVTVVFELK